MRRNYNWSLNPNFIITSMNANLSLKSEIELLKNTFKYFPANWRYTWHEMRSFELAMRGSGTLIVSNALPEGSSTGL